MLMTTMEKDTYIQQILYIYISIFTSTVHGESVTKVWDLWTWGLESLEARASTIRRTSKLSSGDRSMEVVVVVVSVT